MRPDTDYFRDDLIVRDFRDTNHDGKLAFARVLADVFADKDTLIANSIEQRRWPVKTDYLTEFVAQFHAAFFLVVWEQSFFL